MSSADDIHCVHVEEKSCTNQYKGIKVHSGGNEYVCMVSVLLSTGILGIASGNVMY